MKKPQQKALQTWKLKDAIDKNLIELDAPYQRDIVWNDKKMSDLIDSLLFNYYVPPLIFALRRVGNKSIRTCVDGKQRLTSIVRFMNNEIPYYDRSVDPPIPRYYSADQGFEEGRQYITDEEVIRFNKVEIICVDYSQLTEDDEYDVFSRVQMGVQINSAEKLRAHNTAVAKKIRELSSQYAEINQILPSSTLAQVFKSLAEFFICLDSEESTVNLTAPRVTQYILSGTLKSGVVQAAERSLGLLSQMVRHPASLRALTRYPDHLKNTMVKIELLCLLYYLSKCDQHRSLDDLAKDCIDMRAMFHRLEQRLNFSNRLWGIGTSWCERKWEEIEESRSTTSNITNNTIGSTVYSNFNGMIIQNDGTLGSQSQLQSQSQFNPINIEGEYVGTEMYNPINNASRRRAMNPAHHDRPVARRGGKAPRFN